jgi:hypothetical protein
MGNNETSSTQTTTQTLPANQQTNVDALLQGALDYFNSGGRSFFPGDLVADFDPLQTQGQNQIVNFSQGVGSDLVSNAIGANNRLLDPSIMDPTTNPIFTNLLGHMLTANTQNFNEQVLPNIRTGAVSSGQFGGTPGEIAEALSTDRFLQSNAQQQNQLGLGQQALGMNAMLSAIRNSPGLFQLGMAPGQAVAGVGEARQNQAQNEIQGEQTRHNFEQNEPMIMLQLLRDLTGQAGTFGGTSTTTGTQSAEGSPFNQVLGTAMALASMVNPAMSLFGGLAPTGMGDPTGGFMQMMQQGGIPSPFGGQGFDPFAGMFPQLTG